MITNTINGSTSEDITRMHLLDSITAHAQDARSLSAWRVEDENQVIKDEIAALKRTSLLFSRQQFGRLASSLAAYSTNIQSLNASRIAHHPQSRAMTSPLPCSDLLLQGPSYPRHLLSENGSLLVYRSALLSHPLDSRQPLFPNSPTFVQTNTSPVALLSTTLRVPSETCVTSDILRDRLNAHSVSSSILRESSDIHAGSVPQNRNENPPRGTSRDHGFVVAPRPSSPLLDQNRIRTTTEPGRKKFFPVVLHRILVELDIVSGGTEIASFLPDGKGFKIWSQFLFVKHILPIYFPNMKNFASFQRQLNLYDFKRIAGVCTNRGGYYHHLFERKVPALASMMKRRKVKSEGASLS